MENTSDYIIEKIAPIFNKQGYIGTSLSDLTTATNLTKGALYCNFANKEELALQAFKYNLRKATSPLYAAIEIQNNSIDKLYAMTNYYRSYYEACKIRGGCPILNVGIDSKHNNTPLFEAAKKATKQMIHGLTLIIQTGIDADEIQKDVDATMIAGNVYAMIEGAIFLNYTQENGSYLDHILLHIESSIIDKIKT